MYKLNPAVALRAVAYTGFRLPTLNELYRSFTVLPVVTNANPDLKPERLRGVELAPASGIAVGLTIFDNQLDDAIANVTTGVNVRQPRNVSAIEAHGIELTASARLGAFNLAGPTRSAIQRCVRRAPRSTVSTPRKSRNMPHRQPSPGNPGAARASPRRFAMRSGNMKTTSTSTPCPTH
ncbi:TonB-dependent receptor domain-containing protein [Sphingomonas panacis]|uniref:TonB-dependent receptor domain-containing protein n=1 Tax=Sphingomonas panacis TaxID=1560345 RepID=UPI000B031581|nr:TonB-dependent receptor [Sphingomonas panacis]